MNRYKKVKRVAKPVSKSGGKSPDRKKRVKAYLKPVVTWVHLKGSKETWSTQRPEMPSSGMSLAA